MPDFHFLRKFLDETVAKVSSIYPQLRAQRFNKPIKSLHVGFTRISEVNFQRCCAWPGTIYVVSLGKTLYSHNVSLYPGQSDEKPAMD